jgi:thioredoxin 2
MVVSEIRCRGCGARNRLGQGRPGAAPRCGRCRSPLPWVVPADDDTFEGATTAPYPVLVDFWAPWCGPCQTLEPVIEDTAAELAGRIKVVQVNVDDSPRSTARFQVRSIPTLVLLDHGRAVDSVVGLVSRRELRSRLATHLPPRS